MHCSTNPETCAQIAIENPQPKGQRRKTTMNAGTLKTYRFLPIAMRHPPGNMRTDRIRKSQA